jgi:hypothetical protein
MREKTVSFSPEIRDPLDGRNFATVATLNQNGGPQTSVVWIARDEDPPAEPADVLRLIVRVTPRKITGFAA